MGKVKQKSSLLKPFEIKALKKHFHFLSDFAQDINYIVYIRLQSFCMDHKINLFTLSLSLSLWMFHLQPASYGKKNGMWYASPGNQGWGNKSAARNSSVLEADITSATPNVLKPSAGRVIRIVNNLDHNVQVIKII